MTPLRPNLPRLDVDTMLADRARGLTVPATPAQARSRAHPGEGDREAGRGDVTQSPAYRGVTGGPSATLLA
jgi:hypothetical protein